MRIAEAIAELHRADNQRINITASHPAVARPLPRLAALALVRLNCTGSRRAPRATTTTTPLTPPRRHLRVRRLDVAEGHELNSPGRALGSESHPDYQGPTGRNYLTLNQHHAFPYSTFPHRFATRPKSANASASGGSYEMAADGCGVTLEIDQQSRNLLIQCSIRANFQCRSLSQRSESVERLVATPLRTQSNGAPPPGSSSDFIPIATRTRKPNTLSLKEHEQRVQQLSDFIEVRCTGRRLPRFKQHLDDLLRLHAHTGHARHIQ